MEKATKTILLSIKEERKAQKLTGSDMGMAKSTYCCLETGRRKMTIDTLVKICNRLGVKIELSKKLN